MTYKNPTTSTPRENAYSQNGWRQKRATSFFSSPTILPKGVLFTICVEMTSLISRKVSIYYGEEWRSQQVLNENIGTTAW